MHDLEGIDRAPTYQMKNEDFCHVGMNFMILIYLHTFARGQPSFSDVSL
jgi:hypothetical protein